MLSKVLILALAIAAVFAQESSHDHGHAYSSQSIVLHNTHHDNDHKVQKETIAYFQPAVHHVDPVVSHIASVHHVAPVVHHVAPVIHQAPIAHHVAPVVEHVAPVVHHVASSIQAAPSHVEQEHHDYYAHPKYEFAYEVKDTHTHDIKSQHEIRDGDVVKGEYSLHQPDGAVRTVKYYGDHKSGFNAEVHYDAPSHHVQPAHHDNHH
ncbi:cuticle protein 18.6-like [Hyposmocoma kahamanoa]|uniref:cuticle protein 18.6-like n=1 Tax=Hyposmocoma kahamanoa TaxID=1477025 RepID=UPI000E6D967F|nr:cuticle protein 18.6-like [Hyposmocoma kahamanoa]